MDALAFSGSWLREDSSELMMADRAGMCQKKRGMAFYADALSLESLASKTHPSRCQQDLRSHVNREQLSADRDLLKTPNHPDALGAMSARKLFPRGSSGGVLSLDQQLACRQA